MKAVGVQATTMSVTIKIITATTLIKMVGDMAMETSVSGSVFKPSIQIINKGSR